MGTGAGVRHAAGKRRALIGRPDTGQETPSASGYRGHPPRSNLDRVERDNPVGVPAVVVRCVDREEDGAPSGGRMTQHANSGGRKATGNRDRWSASPLAVPHNWPDTGLMPGPERVLTWVR